MIIHLINNVENLHAKSTPKYIITDTMFMMKNDIL